MTGDDHDRVMRSSLVDQQRAWRGGAEAFDQIADALRATEIDNPQTLLAVDVMLDNMRVVSVVGSIELATRALAEALRYIGPRMVDESYSQIRISYAGWRP